MITDSEGNSLEYSSGMQYKGNDTVVKEQVSVLNQMNGVENGQKVLSTLINSDKTYNITNGRSANGTGCTIENNNGATVRMNNNTDFMSVSHEMFHCYQYDNGQGGASIHNEVEAYLYSTTLYLNVNDGCGAQTSFSTPQNSLSQNNDLYSKSVGKLIYNECFDQKSFDIVIQLFKTCSGSNLQGLYNNYPEYNRGQSNSLLQNFYPLYR